MEKKYKETAQYIIYNYYSHTWNSYLYYKPFLYVIAILRGEGEAIRASVLGHPKYYEFRGAFYK